MMKRTFPVVRGTRRFLTTPVLFASCAIFAPLVSGDTVVLRWNGPAVQTNVWNTTAAAWLDSGENAVAWQSGAEARFDGEGETVDVATDVAASNLTFAADGYTLSGTGRLSVAGALFATDAVTATVSSELRSTVGLSKTGGGTLALSNPNAALTNAMTVAAGTLALQAAAIPGAVSVASPGALTVLPAATNGLTGFYYNVAPATTNFSSLAAMEAHFSSLTPDLVSGSSAAGDSFGFGSSGALFPLPYGPGGPRTNNFEAVWRGTLTIPSSTYYSFKFTHDCGFLLAIDNKMVLNRLVNTVTEGTFYLDAGSHSIVLGYFQDAGLYGLQVEVKALYSSSYSSLPNAWLKPYTTVGTLSGTGNTTLSAEGSSLNTAPKTAAQLSGTLAGTTGSLFTKSGWGLLTLASSAAVSNTLLSDVAVAGGVLALASDERIGDTSTVLIGSDSGLKLTANETLGAITGAGTVTLGGNAAISVLAFTGDADSGLSTNKTYTHLLDFPNNGNPATVNGVVFTSAGTSGNTNGYAWSIANPPTSVTTDNTNDVFYSGSTRLVWDFYYGSADYTITLSGLRPGQAYETRLYFRAYGSVNPTSPRKVTFFFKAGSSFIGSIYYSPDAQYAQSWLSCRYTADASGTLSVRVLAHNSAHTCHLYGLSNEEIAPPLPAPAATAVTWPRAVAFTNDTDSGISTSKTYTHLLDFPTNGNPATVNGVDFIAAGMSGSSFGYGWNTTGTAPVESWNDSPNDSTRSGVDHLLWDFIYDSTNFTVNLTGLHPGQLYEARLYFRCFGNLSSDSPRDINFGFTAGANLIGSVSHDLDTMARSRVECRYRADAAGSLAIHIYSSDIGHTCHLYGLSNEEVGETPTLTLATPAGTNARHTGAVSGTGALVKQGDGTQRLGGTIRLTAPLDVQAGTLSLESGASVLSGAVVRAGAVLAAPNGNVWLGGLTGSGTFSLSGVPPYPVTNLLYTVTFTNDAGTGVSTAKTYTHLLDFGTRTNVAVINGVPFTKVASQNGSTNGYGWANFPPLSHGGGVPSATYCVPDGTGAYDLLYDMDYGWSWPGAATMQLTGLTPGKRYEVHLFNRTWGWGGSRTQTLTFDPDGAGPITESITFNPDQLYANYVAYRYTPVSTTLNITVQSAQSNQTYHLYGLSNEETSDASYVPVTVNIAHDSVFAGLVTGSGDWDKTGAGALTLTATNTASGALTVCEGALCVTNGATATLGPVTVAWGATLFGSGRVGGNVTVADHAAIRAGFDGNCGALAIGSNLVVQSGAILVWRFGSGTSDLITVGGRLTFPTNGIMQAVALNSDVSAPAKTVLFASTQTINGPDTLTGWTVTGVNKATLAYSDDRTKIYLACPRGTVILVH